MAKHKIPPALAMRDLKYGSSNEAARSAVAEALQAADRRSEALLLYEGRGEHPFVRAERDWAIEEGNAFHLLSAHRLGCPVSDDQFRACAEAAEAKGRWMDARNCWVVLEDVGALERIAEHLPESLRPTKAEDSGEAQPSEG